MSAEDKTYLCRCEDVTLEEIREELEKGAVSFEDLKRRLRCTMGPCQGKTCRSLITQEIARFKEIPQGKVDVPTYRMLTRPIKLGELAKMALGGDRE